jgi:hypothetical protein
MTGRPTLADLQAQVDCAASEVERRLRDYPRLVDAGALSQRAAAHGITTMRGIVRTLQGLIDARQLDLFDADPAPWP